MKKLNISQTRGIMLDFGCGVGRLARHWLKHFDKYIGSDISKAMIERARKINQDLSSVEFLENDNSLKIFSDNNFNFIYSGIVLQHMPDRETIKKYIIEFKRILKPDGVLVFQLPSRIPWHFRFQPIRKLYSIFRFLGLSDGFLYNQLGLYPIKMNFIPETDVKNFLEKLGLKIIDIKHDSYCGPLVDSRTYYCQK